MLGILGGMGPAATVDFMAKLIRLEPAARDQDHLPLVVVSDPRVLGAGRRAKPDDRFGNPEG